MNARIVLIVDEDATVTESVATRTPDHDEARLRRTALCEVDDVPPFAELPDTLDNP